MSKKPNRAKRRHLRKIKRNENKVLRSVPVQSRRVCLQVLMLLSTNAQMVANAHGHVRQKYAARTRAAPQRAAHIPSRDKFIILDENGVCGTYSNSKAANRALYFFEQGGRKSLILRRIL